MTLLKSYGHGRAEYATFLSRLIDIPPDFCYHNDDKSNISKRKYHYGQRIRIKRARQSGIQYREILHTAGCCRGR